MPSNRTRRARQWRPTLDPFRRVALLVGPEHVLLAGAGYHPVGCSMLHMLTEDQHAEVRAAMRSDWLVHGEGLTRWWVEAAPESVGHPWEYVTPGGPGTRPWAWWQFTARGPRRQGESEAAALARLGMLPADERARTRWRR